MKDCHCSDCGRFLCKVAHGQVEIKCPNNKCKKINKIKVVSYEQLLTASDTKDILKA